MINCVITSPEATKRYKNVQSVTLPAFLGEMQILPGHAEAFILLQEGNIILQQLNRQNEVIRITSGECYVKDNVVVVIL
jgi:F0F1-type ATP synthase epsilon subunit